MLCKPTSLALLVTLALSMSSMSALADDDWAFTTKGSVSDALYYRIGGGLAKR